MTGYIEPFICTIISLSSSVAGGTVFFPLFSHLYTCIHSSSCLCSEVKGEVSLSTLGSKVVAQQALDQLFSLSADTKLLLFPPTSSGAALETSRGRSRHTAFPADGGNVAEIPRRAGRCLACGPERWPPAGAVWHSVEVYPECLASYCDLPNEPSARPHAGM